jgi:hypothetical protein
VPARIGGSDVDLDKVNTLPPPWAREDIDDNEVSRRTPRLKGLAGAEPRWILVAQYLSDPDDRGSIAQP